jgi:hypothetical protein
LSDFSVFDTPQQNTQFFKELSTFGMCRAAQDIESKDLSSKILRDNPSPSRDLPGETEASPSNRRSGSAVKSP